MPSRRYEIFSAILPCAAVLAVGQSACDVGEETETGSVDTRPAALLPACGGAQVSITGATGDPNNLIDDNEHTGISTGRTAQSVIIDLGCEVQVRGFRRYTLPRAQMQTDPAPQGERVSVSADGVNWGSWTHTSANGWSGATNPAPDRWLAVGTHWSPWLRPSLSAPTTRYIRYEWDGAEQLLYEINVDYLTTFSSDPPTPGHSANYVADGDVNTGFQSANPDWQSVTIDLRQPALIGQIRRHMSNAGLGGRGSAGEGISLSLDGTTFESVETAHTDGWQNYNDYGPTRWNALPYGWSDWLTLNSPQPARYIRYEWDANSGDTFDELQVSRYTDGGDPAYDFDHRDPAFNSAFNSRMAGLLPAGPTPPSNLRWLVGMTGVYQGAMITGVGSTPAPGTLVLVDDGAEVRGRLYISGEHLVYRGGSTCGDVPVQGGLAFDVRMRKKTCAELSWYRQGSNQPLPMVDGEYGCVIPGFGSQQDPQTITIGGQPVGGTSAQDTWWGAEGSTTRDLDHGMQLQIQLDVNVHVAPGGPTGLSAEIRLQPSRCNLAVFNAFSFAWQGYQATGWFRQDNLLPTMFGY